MKLIRVLFTALAFCSAAFAQTIVGSASGTVTGNVTGAIVGSQIAALNGANNFTLVYTPSGTPTISIQIEGSSNGGSTYSLCGSASTINNSTTTVTCSGTSYDHVQVDITSNSGGTNPFIVWQLTTTKGSGAIAFSGVPSGSCSGTQMAINTTNGNLYTCNGGSWSAVSSSVTFPVLAPEGSNSAPSYAFSTHPTSGMWEISSSTTLQSDNGIVQINACTSCTTPNVVELYIRPTAAGNNDGVIEMFSGEASQTQYRLVDVGSTNSPSNVGDFEIRDSQFLTPGQNTVLRVQHENGSVVMESTSSTQPVIVRSNSVANGTRSTNESWIYQDSGKALNIQPQQTGVNAGNTKIGPCKFDNSSDNSGTGVLDCTMPINQGQPAFLRLYTSDGTPFGTATGTVGLSAEDASGLGHIDSANDSGFALRFWNHTQATNFALIKANSSGLGFGANTTTAPNWLINTSGHFVDQGTHLMEAGAFESIGTTFTSSGGCTEGSLTGGASAGKFTTSGSTSCTTVITTGLTAAHGWHCTCSDITTAADSANCHETTSNTTTATLATGTIVASDVIEFACEAY